MNINDNKSKDFDILGQYYREISQYEAPTDEENRDLIIRAQNGDENADRNSIVKKGHAIAYGILGYDSKALQKCLSALNYIDKKIVVPFEGTEDTIRSLLKHLNK